MPWIEKHQPSSFDSLPIHGLHFLDGNVLARLLLLQYGGVETPLIKPEWLKEQKLAQVQFPSGLSFDIWETSTPESGGIISIFGELSLPYFDMRDRAWEQANDIAEQLGYLVRKWGENQLEVIGYEEGEHFLITYDNQERRIADIALVKRLEREIPQREPLLDQASRERLPKLYSQEQLGLNALAQVKLFSLSSNWTWYASEASAAMEDGTYKALTEVEPDDPYIHDVIFFGLVDGFELELGYFSLSELQGVGGGLQLPIERDRHFAPTTLQDLQDKHCKERAGGNE